MRLVTYMNRLCRVIARFRFTRTRVVLLFAAAFVVAIVLGMWRLTCPETQGNPVAVVILSIGTVEEKMHEHYVWRPANRGTQVWGGDNLRTRNHSLAVLKVLEDGEIIRLRSNQTVSIHPVAIVEWKHPDTKTHNRDCKILWWSIYSPLPYGYLKCDH